MSPSPALRRLAVAALVLPFLIAGVLSGDARATRARGRAAAHPAAKVTKTVLLERRVPATKGGLPNIQARGAIVLDEDGHELYARNPDQERPIASISKLAATLAVVDRGLDLEGLTTITKADIEVARGGARSRLLEGMTLSNRDLLHAALMGSDNRAIPALGRAVKLAPAQLAAAMTAKAAELGLKHTRFHDPTGLSIQNVSTPRETVALLQAVIRNPVLGPITERVQYDAHPVGRPPIRYTNTYRPAIRPHVQVVGGKTGYNDDARYCLVIATKIDGRMCYMSFLANEGKLTRFGDVARVADWMVGRRPRAAGAAQVAASSPEASDVPGAPIVSAAPPPAVGPVEPESTVRFPRMLAATAPAAVTSGGTEAPPSPSSSLPGTWTPYQQSAPLVSPAPPPPPVPGSINSR